MGPRLASRRNAADGDKQTDVTCTSMGPRLASRRNTSIALTELTKSHFNGTPAREPEKRKVYEFSHSQYSLQWDPGSRAGETRLVKRGRNRPCPFNGTPAREPEKPSILSEFCEYF